MPQYCIVYQIIKYSIFGFASWRYGYTLYIQRILVMSYIMNLLLKTIITETSTREEGTCYITKTYTYWKLNKIKSIYYFQSNFGLDKVVNGVINTHTSQNTGKEVLAHLVYNFAYNITLLQTSYIFDTIQYLVKIN